jgi:hypothetical protein
MQEWSGCRACRAICHARQVRALLLAILASNAHSRDASTTRMMSKCRRHHHSSSIRRRYSMSRNLSVCVKLYRGTSCVSQNARTSFSLLRTTHMRTHARARALSLSLSLSVSLGACPQDVSSQTLQKLAHGMSLKLSAAEEAVKRLESENAFLKKSLQLQRMQQHSHCNSSERSSMENAESEALQQQRMQQQMSMMLQTHEEEPAMLLSLGGESRHSDRSREGTNGISKRVRCAACVYPNVCGCMCCVYVCG